MKDLVEDPKTFQHLSKPKIDLLEQINSDTGRLYQTPSGIKYPSITTVLSILNKEAIMKWRKRVGEKEADRISKRATVKGTRVHKYFEDYINNETVLFESKDFLAKESFYKLKPVVDMNVDGVVLQEERLYSDYLEIAGQVDLIAHFGGKLSIIDFKTASKPKKEEWIQNYFMQASAYAIMYEERTGTPVPRIVLLIAVDHEEPQIFVRKRDDYVDALLDTRKRYKEQYGI